jgi:hypothetical protein
MTYATYTNMFVVTIFLAIIQPRSWDHSLVHDTCMLCGHANSAKAALALVEHALRPGDPEKLPLAGGCLNKRSAALLRMAADVALDFDFSLIQVCMGNHAGHMPWVDVTDHGLVGIITNVLGIYVPRRKGVTHVHACAQEHICMAAYVILSINFTLTQVTGGCHSVDRVYTTVQCHFRTPFLEMVAGHVLRNDNTLLVSSWRA